MKFYCKNGMSVSDEIALLYKVKDSEVLRYKHIKLELQDL
jgi:hypothetical protein